jgi:hypothetical protein
MHFGMLEMIYADLLLASINDPKELLKNSLQVQSMRVRFLFK